MLDYSLTKQTYSIRIKVSPRSGRLTKYPFRSCYHRSVARFTGFVCNIYSLPSSELLGYFRPSAMRTQLPRGRYRSRFCNRRLCATLLQS